MFSFYKQPISSQSHIAIILCGGQGRRLGALSLRCPKCLLRVSGIPILLSHLEIYEALGIREVILAVGHLGGKVRDAVASWQKQIKFHFVDASNLGTGGALLQALRFLPLRCDHLWVSMGDIVCWPDLQTMWKRVQATNAQAVILGTCVLHPASYGTLICDANGWLLDFKEKQVKKGPAIIDAGFYLFRREFFSKLKECNSLSLEYDVFPHAQGVAVVEHEGYWFDVGSVKKLREARTLAKQFVGADKALTGV